MSSKLDYLKKYTAGTKPKKREAKEISKEAEAQHVLQKESPKSSDSSNIP
jgi:hypothetical protein